MKLESETMLPTFLLLQEAITQKLETPGTHVLRIDIEAVFPVDLIVLSRFLCRENLVRRGSDQQIVAEVVIRLNTVKVGGIEDHYTRTKQKQVFDEAAKFLAQGKVRSIDYTNLANYIMKNSTSLDAFSIKLI